MSRRSECTPLSGGAGSESEVDLFFFSCEFSPLAVVGARCTVVLDAAPDGVCTPRRLLSRDEVHPRMVDGVRCSIMKQKKEASGRWGSAQDECVLLHGARLRLSAVVAIL